MFIPACRLPGVNDTDGDDLPLPSPLTNTGSAHVHCDAGTLSDMDASSHGHARTVWMPAATGRLHTN